MLRENQRVPICPNVAYFLGEIIAVFIDHVTVRIMERNGNGRTSAEADLGISCIAGDEDEVAIRSVCRNGADDGFQHQWHHSSDADSSTVDIGVCVLEEGLECTRLCHLVHTPKINSCAGGHDDPALSCGGSLYRDKDRSRIVEEEPLRVLQLGEWNDIYRNSVDGDLSSCRRTESA